jgi:hypothetical protein
MKFTPNEPHVTVALVLGGAFGQFADPIDWVARQFGLDLKVDRVQLAESLAMKGGGVSSASRAYAEALASDKRTKMSIEMFGRCEGRLVALCAFSFNPARLTLKQIEERAVDTIVLKDTIVLNDRTVLGVQCTTGGGPKSIDGLTAENAIVRLLPLNIFSRPYFQDKIELIENDKKLEVLDAGDAAVIKLVKPWLFYDAPPRRKSKKPIALLPF